tara:strand:- start:278 stop:793 length:516 start_codon:yes stop_codon:yes gene_type:complete
MANKNSIDMQPSYVGFKEKEYKWKPGIDYRKNPHLYKIGRGQQGVLVCEPYKSEIGQYWRFKNPKIAKQSAESIYKMFINYLKEDDFVGADMAKKYLHMGFTRSRRYANHKSGVKWTQKRGEWVVLPQEKDWDTSEKAQSANIFKEYWKKARTHGGYLVKKANFKLKYNGK